jgi:hypothetical protein
MLEEEKQKGGFKWVTFIEIGNANGIETDFVDVDVASFAFADAAD